MQGGAVPRSRRVTAFRIAGLLCALLHLAACAGPAADPSSQQGWEEEIDLEFSTETYAYAYEYRFMRVVDGVLSYDDAELDEPLRCELTDTERALLQSVLRSTPLDAPERRPRREIRDKLWYGDGLMLHTRDPLGRRRSLEASGEPMDQLRPLDQTLRALSPGSKAGSLFLRTLGAHLLDPIGFRRDSIASVRPLAHGEEHAVGRLGRLDFRTPGAGNSTRIDVDESRISWRITFDGSGATFVILDRALAPLEAGLIRERLEKLEPWRNSTAVEIDGEAGFWAISELELTVPAASASPTDPSRTSRWIPRPNGWDGVPPPPPGQQELLAFLDAVSLALDLDYHVD